MHPDEIQDILDTEKHEYSCDEAVEVAIGAMATDMISKVGLPVVEEFVATWALANEKMLRADYPNHPALEVLDQRRAERG